MNGPIGSWLLGAGAIVLTWFPQPALALDVVVAKFVLVTDAQFGGGKLVVGRKLKISCGYSYPIYAKLPSWKVRLEVDGKAIANLDATLPTPHGGYNVDPKTGKSWTTPQSFTATGNWTAAAAGNHVAKCILDPDTKLAGIEAPFDKKNNISEKTFIVDVVVPTFPGDLGSGKPKDPPAAVAVPGSLPAPASGRGFAPQGPGTVAQGSQPMVLDPAITMALAAKVLPNCGAGQDVVRVSGTIKNVGSGFAVIPPGKPIVEIKAQAGVYGGAITVGNLAPGQTQQVSAMLKSKGLPKSLAGATLTLSAEKTGVIKQGSYGVTYQELTVVFPPDYCKQGSGSPTPRLPVVPMNPATPRQTPAAPAPQRPAPARQ